MALLILLHEAGHAIESAGNSRHRGSHLIDDVRATLMSNNRYHAELLKAERDAWAFALNRLRPFVSRRADAVFNMTTITSAVHQEYLQTYSDDIRSERRQPRTLYAKRLGTFVLARLFGV